MTTLDTPADRIAHLERLNPGVLAHIPEIGADFPATVGLLRAVERLGLDTDRRLLGIDATNLITGVEGVVRLRHTGLDTTTLNEAARDLSRLVRDMHHRADRLLAQEAHNVAIHSSVAAHKAEEDGPLDVTRELRLITAAPTPRHTDAPGRFVDLAPLLRADETAYGRISGACTTCEHPIVRQTAAQDSAVLPAGHVVQFDANDAFWIHTNGMASGDAFAQPSTGLATKALLVEAGPEGVTVHGPAVLSVVPDAKGLLSDASAARSFSADLDSLLPNPRLERPTSAPEAMFLLFGVPMVCMIVAVFFSIGGTHLWAWLTSNPEPSPTMASMFVWYGILLSLCYLPMIAGKVWERRKKRATILNTLARMPKALRNGSLLARCAALFSRTTNPSPLEAVAFNEPMFLATPRMDQAPVLHQALDTLRHHTQGVNISPPIAIATRQDSPVRIIAPLPALPAPSAFDEVVIPLRPVMAKA